MAIGRRIVNELKKKKKKNGEEIRRRIGTKQQIALKGRGEKEEKEVFSGSKSEEDILCQQRWCWRRPLEATTKGFRGTLQKTKQSVRQQSIHWVLLFFW